MKKNVKTGGTFELLLGGIALVAMLIILTIQVVGRYAFGKSLSWSEECARYLFIWFVYITASYAIYERSHIKIDAAMNLYPTKIRPYVGILGDVVFLVYALIIAFYSTKYTYNMYITGRVSLALGIKLAFVYFAIPFCHWLMSVRLIANIVQDLIAIIKRKEAEN